MKKPICLLICISFALLPLISCGGNGSGDQSGFASAAFTENSAPEQTAVSEPERSAEESSESGETGENEYSKTLFSFRGAEISAGRFVFELAAYKRYFKQQLEYTDVALEAYLRAVIYDENGDLLPVYKAVTRDIAESVKYKLVIKRFCGEYGLELSDRVRGYIDDVLQRQAEISGGRKWHEQALAEIGLDVETEREYYTAQWLKELLFDYLYGENGARRIDAETETERVREEFENNCFRAEEVTYVYHAFYTDTMTADESEEVRRELDSRARTTYEKAKAGELELADFADETTSPDPYGRYYQHLINYYYEDDELFEKLAEMEIGEYALFDGYYGPVVIRKLAPTEEDFEKCYDTVLSALADKDFDEYIESFYSEINIDTEELAKYDILNAPDLE